MDEGRRRRSERRGEGEEKGGRENIKKGKGKMLKGREIKKGGESEEKGVRQNIKKGRIT